MGQLAGKWWSGRAMAGLGGPGQQLTGAADSDLLEAGKHSDRKSQHARHQQSDRGALLVPLVDDGEGNIIVTGM
jgi:hypothetical protein